MSGRLERSRTNRVIGGVCGGLGEYLDIDATFVRVVMVILGFGGIGILIYIALLILMPQPGEVAPFVRPVGDATAPLDPTMPLAPQANLRFPYVEGLRLDEAMHPLALLTFGMYGETLPPQNGAPIRMVVPWKYGFKSIKSIVKIKLQSGMPRTTWNDSSSQEYGFYSNVNPEVDHPRWTQKTERRLGEFGKRQTLMFNGYGDQVASLYAGMDLRKNH